MAHKGLSKTSLLHFISKGIMLLLDLRAACQYLKGPTGRMERDFSQGCEVIGQGGTALNQKRADLD